MVDVYRYDGINNEAGINTDPITGYKLYVGGKTRINGNLEILDTETTYLNEKDYLNFKDIKSSHNSLKVDSTSKLLELNYYNKHFKDSTDADGTKTNKFRLKLKTDPGMIEDANGLLIDVKASNCITNDVNGLSQTFLITDTINGIEKITTTGIDKDKIQLKLKPSSALIEDTFGLTINYDSTNFTVETGQTDNNKLKIKVEDNMGISLGTSG